MLDNPDRKPDIGILYIHGIGNQGKGEPLAQLTAAIYKWIDNSITGLARRWSFEGLTNVHLIRWIKQLAKESPVKPQRPVDGEDQQNSDCGPEMEWWRARLKLYGDDCYIPRVDLLEKTFLHAKRATAIPEDADDKIKKTGKNLEIRYVGGKVKLENWAAGSGADEPAHTNVKIEALDLEGKLHTSNWLLAESWWASSMLTSRYWQSAAWTIIALPWSIASLLGHSISRGVKTISRLKERNSNVVVRAILTIRLILIVMLSPLASASAVLMQVLLVVVGLLGSMPIAGIRKSVRVIQDKFTMYAGDVWALTRSPVREASIVQRVIDDLEWLQTKCKRVVIVAHSQGAAIAHLALLKRIPNNLGTFVTFGSGLRKLKEFHRSPKLSKQNFHIGTALGLLNSLAVLLTIEAAFNRSFLQYIGLPGSESWVFPWWWYAISSVFFCYMLILYTRQNRNSEEMRYWVESLSEQNVSWYDFFASHDPIPDGPIFVESSSKPPPQGLHPVEVHNFSSVIADHTGYLKNEDGFVSKLIKVISEECRESLQIHKLFVSDAVLFDHAPVRRRWRLRFLRGSRWLLLSGLFTLAMSRLRGGLSTNGFFLEMIQSKVCKDVLHFFDIQSLADQYLQSANTREAVDVMSIAIGAYLCYKLLKGIWSFWSWWDKHIAFAGLPFRQSYWLNIIIVNLGLFVYSAANVIVFSWVIYYAIDGSSVPGYVWFVGSLLVLGLLAVLSLRFASPKAGGIGNS